MDQPKNRSIETATVSNMRHLLFSIDNKQMTVLELRRRLFGIEDQSISDLDQIAEFVNQPDSRPTVLEGGLPFAVLEYLRQRDCFTSKRNLGYHFQHVLTGVGELASCLSRLQTKGLVEALALPGCPNEYESFRAAP